MLTEQCSLHRFGEIVTVHFLCGAVFGTDLLISDAVSDEKIPLVNVTGFISTQIITVPLHEDGTLVIMVYNMLVHLETLSL